ncbi:MAG: 4'-phosphopantetheinyl transferase superfamily protein [Bacteroides sp.]|nr:4'-phosphopantetheinyl transferase superfamily protein [Bacteroides sp.]
MPIWKQWSSEGALWGIWKITESPEELRAMLVSDLPYQTEMEALKSPSRKLEYLAVRVLLKVLVAGEELAIAHLPSGQPYLPGDFRRISISHTRGYAAVGIHSSALPGIDIEQVAERVLKVTSRFIRPDEFLEREDLSPERQLEGALLYWSGKETLFKLLETDEVDFLAHLQILPFLPQVSGTMHAREYRTGMNRSFDLSYLVTSDFVCTWGVK